MSFPLACPRGGRERGSNSTRYEQTIFRLHFGEQTKRHIVTGITSDLIKRVWQHKNNSAEGFTKKYNVKILVYYEIYNDAESAITREKRIKKWRRAWKLRLIEEKNPHWKDLYDEII